MTSAAENLQVFQESAPSSKGGEGVIVIHTTEAKLKEAEAKIFEIQNLNVLTPSLAKLSTFACIFQLIEAAILFVLASQNDNNWNWFTSYPDPDGFSIPQPNKIASFSILFYSPVFVAMSAFNHLFSLFFRDTYVWYIERNQNPFRWTEYTFSASIMRVLIAQLVGVTDIHLLFCIFVLTAICIQCGATFETVNAKARADGLDKKWRPFFVSWAAQIAGWFIILNYFAVGISNGSEDSFLWGVVLIFCILDSSFAIVFTLQWMEIGPFKNYVTGEKAFIILSFTSKTFLAWITLAGVFNQY